MSISLMATSSSHARSSEYAQKRPTATVLLPTNDLLWSLPRPPPPLSKQKGAWKSPGVRRQSCQGRYRRGRRLPFMWPPLIPPSVVGPCCPLLRRPRSSALKWLSGRRSDALIQFDCLALHVLSGWRRERSQRHCRGGLVASQLQNRAFSR